MLFAYGRVSTAAQSSAHQSDAFARAGVAPENTYVDVASGAKASRPKLDEVLKLLRDGDTLVITRLDRLGRSMAHLVGLGTDLRSRGVDLRVLEQGIDTTTPEGRATAAYVTPRQPLAPGPARRLRRSCSCQLAPQVLDLGHQALDLTGAGLGQLGGMAGR